MRGGDQGGRSRGGSKGSVGVKGEIKGGSKGSGEDLGQIQGRSMRSGMMGTRGVSKEGLGGPGGQRVSGGSKGGSRG